MSIFERFKSKEELLEAVNASIAQDGEEFVLHSEELEEREKKIKELQSKFDSERTGHQKMRNRAQEQEKRVKELETEMETKNSLIEDLNRLNPEETREQLKSLMTSNRELEQRAKRAEEALPDLQKEIGIYKARDLAAKKQSELRALAKEAGVWDPAIDDIVMLYDMFEYDNLDQLVLKGENGRSASEWISERLKISPHWKAPSEGGGSHPSGSTRSNAYDPAKAAELCRNGDFAGAIAMKYRASVAEQG